MDFREEKIVRRIMELSGHRYLKKKELTDLKYLKDSTEHAKYPPLEREGWGKVVREEMIRGRNSYFWFTQKLTVPVIESATERFVILLDFTKFIGGRVRDLEGFEAFAYIDGKPYQGFDQNHKELFLDASYANRTIEFSFMLWTGLEAGGAVQTIEHRLNSCSTALLSKVTDALYYNMILLLKTARVIEDSAPEKEKVLKVLDQTTLHIDWQNPGSESFYASIEQANTYIENEMSQFKHESSATVTGVGHTHIDVAWLWQLQHTREKAARSFSTVLRLMENYPEYTFLQSQPQLYAYIKEDFPEIFQAIKERVEEGRWEADGAMWIEPDCNVPSGESLVRQILYGAKFFKEEFGKEMNYLWLPDVFGYSWALPQILKKSGIDMLMTTKLSWNQYNRMPNDTFIWRGIDGSEIKTHFITTPNPNSSNDAVGAVYSGLMEPATVKGIYKNYKNKTINDHLLLAYGHGDGGGGTDREMMEMVTRMQKYSLPTLPKVETGTAKAYFEKLKDTVDTAPETEVSVWDGELYLEYHRGTYTSQGRVKNENRRLELGYRDIELMASVASMSNALTYPHDLFKKGWEIILRNQFHDILPGCAINEVYQDNINEYTQAFELLNQIKALIPLDTDEAQTWTLFNTASWERDEQITLPVTLPEGQVIMDENDHVYETIESTNGTELLVKGIPAFGSKVFSMKQSIKESVTDKECPFVKGEQSIESPYYIIEWDDKGHLIRIYDKDQQREVLKSKGNVFQLFEDKPMSYDAWDIDIYYQEKGNELAATTLFVESMNTLNAKVTFTYEFNRSRIEQSMILYAHDRRIDFETELDWFERQQVLKVGFDLAIRSVEATYDIQYGNVKRSTHWNTSWDKARFETVGHQWVDLSEHGYGVSLLNDSKYGHDIKDSQIRLTLVTGAIDPDPTADEGKHHFTYSLLPHKGDFIQAKVPEQAWELNDPSRILNGRTDALKSLFTIESEGNVFVDAVKRSENGEGIILRFHDHTGGKRNVQIHVSQAVQEWTETDLLERPITESIRIKDHVIQLTLDPFEIKTVLIK